MDLLDPANSGLQQLIEEEKHSYLKRWKAADFFLIPLAHMRRFGCEPPEAVCDDGDRLLTWAQEQLADVNIWEQVSEGNDE